MAAFRVGHGEENALRYACLPCRRKFYSAVALQRHERMSDAHRKSLEKREDKMRKRKKELIMAVRSVRHQIYEADEALQSQTVVNDMVQNQKGILELQLQQMLGEYGQAQEIIEASKEIRDAREAGVEPPRHVREMRVGNVILTAGVASWQSNKEVQEDRYVLGMELKAPCGGKIAGFCVMDGHSGSLCVDHLVEALPGHLQSCINTKQKLTDEALTQAVHEACILTDDEFLKKARNMEVLDGSTLIMALVYPRPELASGAKLLIACVGDSRAVLCRASSQQLLALPLSQDHKPNRPDEVRRIESKGGIVDFEGVWRVFMPGPAKFGGQLISRWGLAVSRAFGDLLLKEADEYGVAGVAPGGLVISQPEVVIMDLQPAVDRFLVLASDGVWDVISNEAAVGICAAQPSPDLAAHRLLRHTYASNTDDNITALVVSWRSVAS
eukprot:TRINITY_DN27313_c0_g1_i1.p1 TRINITY_DN27313_c0_g1~~TRINITY_DN27313_c0_g1_i1.p1  ORF type:complete len:457 (-),score=112.91 TRINITY_DN27313_c0_g1_i1:195-1517(-)